MRDRDAAALLREISTILARAGDRILPARARLRTWADSGLPSGGNGAGSSEPHSDPVLRTVQTHEVRSPVGKQVGWRADDPWSVRLRKMDQNLHDLRVAALRLDSDLEKILIDTAALGVVGEEGCQLCNAARLPMNGDKTEHECDQLCQARDHRHASSHQPIHNRKAPKPATEDDEPLPDLPRCQFHYLFARRLGVDAHPTITLWKLDHPGSDRVPYSMIRDFHPAEFAAFQAARRTRATA